MLFVAHITRIANIACNTSFISDLNEALLQSLEPNPDWMFVTFSCVQRRGQTLECNL